jgi:hypothetical protein
MQPLFVSLLIGFAICMVASVLVWLLQLQRYIERHGEPTASVTFNGAIWRDYQTARQIADRIGHKPGSLIWFERLSVTAIAFFIAGVLALVIESLK